ncbi:MAG: hypothetical protein J7L91_05525, partial [Candidatus Korarchaeota archaeon]|nr:hypothetical protein [Candidatus Korarchaeota archaeon]
VHVAGLTVLRHQTAYYRLDGGSEICSISTIVPLAIKLQEELSSVIVVLPHSLILHSRPKVGENPEKWFEESTRYLPEVFHKHLVELAVVQSTGVSEDRLDFLGNLLRENLRIRVVQAHGSFKSSDGWKITFHGNPAHTFSEVYAALLREKPDKVHVDLSQGWNHYTVAALLGATAYSKVTGAELSMHYTETFVSGLTKQCSVEGGPYRAGSSGGTQSERSIGRGLTKVPDPPSLGIGTLHTVSRLNEVVERLSEIMNVSGAIIELPKLISLYRTLEEEYSGYSGYGELEGGHNMIMEALLRLRRTSCAFSTTVVPYLHRSLEMLAEVERPLNAIRDRLLEMIGKGIFLEASPEVEDGVLEVFYSLKPPLSLPLVDASSRIIRSFLELRKNLSDQIRGRMSLRLVDRLRDRYEDLGMVPNMVLLYNEMDLVDGEGNIRSAVASLRDQSDGEGVMKRLKRFFRLLERVISRVGDVHGIGRDIYPFFEARLIKNDERDIEERLTKDEGAWESERSQWINLLKKKSQSGRESQYEKNLRVALQLMDPSERRSVSPNDIRTPKRHLQAHIGFQHFSIKNLVPKGGDVYVLYYDELFEAMEERVLLPSEIGILPDDLRREAGSLCDEVE